MGLYIFFFCKKTETFPLTGLSASEGGIIASESGHKCFGGWYYYFREQHNRFVGRHNLLDGGIIASEGGIIVSEGGIILPEGVLVASEASEGGITSEGGIIVSEGGIVHSEGGIIASEVDIIASEGDIVALEGGIIASEGGVKPRTRRCLGTDCIRLSRPTPGRPPHPPGYRQSRDPTLTRLRQQAANQRAERPAQHRGVPRSPRSGALTTSLPYESRHQVLNVFTEHFSRSEVISRLRRDLSLDRWRVCRRHLGHRVTELQLRRRSSFLRRCRRRRRRRAS